MKKLSSIYKSRKFLGSQILLQKCWNLEPEDSSQTYELNKEKKMVEDIEKIHEKIKDKNEMCRRAIKKIIKRWSDS